MTEYKDWRKPEFSIEEGERVCPHIAEQHVDWFLSLVRPLMITQFIHGFKHGQQFEQGMERIRRG